MRRSRSTSPVHAAPGAVLAEVAAELGVRDGRVLDAMRAVPRARFVPPRYATLAGVDTPVPIGHEQVTTQPSLVAVMLEALELRGAERVLEVGTGFGYQTALLARLAEHTWSVEWWADLADTARANLLAAGATNVDVVVGDGSRGLSEHAPYDAIVVAATFTSVPPPLAGQLADGGRLVQPLGPGGDEQVTLFLKTGSRLQRVRVISRAHFVRLVGTHGFPPASLHGSR